MANYVAEESYGTSFKQDIQANQKEASWKCEITEKEKVKKLEFYGKVMKKVIYRVLG